MNIITKDMIKRGYEQGLIKLKANSDSVAYEHVLDKMDETGEEFGVVCYIGENWFYFGGVDAEESMLSEYINSHSSKTIIDKIFEAVDDFRSDFDTFGDEYMYYYYFLLENLSDNRLT